MSGLDKLVDKFLDRVFADNRKVSRQEYLYRACSVFRLDKKLAKELLNFLEESGYVINKRENIQFLGKAGKKD